MPEQLIVTEPAVAPTVAADVLPTVGEPGPLTHADVLQAYLADPNAHPGLIGHMQRLAEQERAALLPPAGRQSELEPDSGPDQAPELAWDTDREPKSLNELVSMVREWRAAVVVGEETDGLRRYDPYFLPTTILQSGGYTADQLKVFVDELDGLYDDFRSAHERLGSEDWPYSYLTEQLVDDVPPDILRSVYDAEGMEGAVHRSLEYQLQNRDAMNAMFFFLQISGCDDYLEMAMQKPAAERDPILAATIKSPEFASTTLGRLLQDNNEYWPKTMTPMEASVAKRDWGDKFLEHVVGLPKSLRDEWQFASYSRTMDRNSMLVDGVKLRSALWRLTDSVGQLGIDAAKQLRDQAGIVNLDYYRPDQLNRVVKVLRGDQSEIDYLKAGDVTVVLGDAKGDFNGARAGDRDLFENDRGRSLFFEVNRPSDFYRHLARLEHAGIRPSTLVLSAHGAPGKIAFGGKSGFELSNVVVKQLGEKTIPVITAKGLPRLVRDYMQDSRGIDDNTEARDHRRIILAACSTAVPVPVLRYLRIGAEQAGEWRDVQSNIGIQTRESMAHTIAEAAENPNTDIYAAAYPMSLERDGSDLLFDEYTKVPEGELQIPAPVTHIRLDKLGRLVETTTGRIKLYNGEEPNSKWAGEE